MRRLDKKYTVPVYPLRISDLYLPKAPQTRSSTTAMPCPTPMQAVQRA